MSRTVLITGSTDGIGLETAKLLVSQGEKVLIHGRNPAKLEEARKTLSALGSGVEIETYRADLSRIPEVEMLAKAVAEKHSKLDALINNAGVYKVPKTLTKEGLDMRFVVNTIAPYVLTQTFMPLLQSSSRVVNLSSAAQAPVDLDALLGMTQLSDSDAYAQSKLALTMWSFHMAQSLEGKSPSIIAVNPASFLGSKMVKEAYGMAGKDLSVGAEVLARAALSDEFSDASGKYFDNDIAQFTSPHSDALDSKKCEALVRTIESILMKLR